jgi:hypothetical protein
MLKLLIILEVMTTISEFVKCCGARVGGGGLNASWSETLLKESPDPPISTCLTY